MKKLFLDRLHRDLKAEFVHYAGWQLPLYYESIITEHTYVRVSSAIFDLSYLGRMEISGDGAEKFLEHHISRPLSNRPTGSGFYALMLTEYGTIFADCMVFKLKGRFILSVNPLTTDKVYRRLRDDAPDGVSVRDISEELLCFALQGRRAQFHLQRLTDIELSYIRTGRLGEAFVVGGYEAVIARTSYTGEDGFEIFISPSGADVFLTSVLEVGTHEYLIPAGIGARNSLRIEATYPLYGAELDEGTTPTEADLEEFVSLEHDFIGREGFLRRKEEPSCRRLVAINVSGMRIPRSLSPIYADGRLVGAITRGTYSPVLSRPIALGYVHPDYARVGTELVVNIRGWQTEAEVARKPFYLKKHAGR